MEDLFSNIINNSTELFSTTEDLLLLNTKEVLKDKINTFVENTPFTVDSEKLNKLIDEIICEIKKKYEKYEKSKEKYNIISTQQSSPLKVKKYPYKISFNLLKNLKNHSKNSHNLKEMG